MAAAGDARAVYARVAAPVASAGEVAAVDAALEGKLWPVAGRAQRLFRFQARSVAAMRRMEEAPVGHAPGGLVCEDVGTGKTLMCLALVLLTQGRVARVRNPAERVVSLPEPRPDTLLGLAALAVRQGTADYRAAGLPEELVELVDAQPNFQPFYDHAPQRVLSKRIVPQTQRILVSAATLIAVPNYLIPQWEAEIAKHVRAPLRVHVLRFAADLLPDVDLARCDIVIVGHTYLQRSTAGNVHTVADCTWREWLVSGIEASAEAARSEPLMRIRFKRLIIDEGHLVGARGTSQTFAMRALKAEFRWICTATPTASTDRVADLTRVFNLLFFCQVDPLASAGLTVSRTKFHKAVGLGRAGWEERLLEYLNRVMIRTQAEERLREAPLPAVCTQQVPVPLAAHEAFVYNQLVGSTVANLVSSKGKGPDSLLSARNARYAADLLRKILDATFQVMTGDKVFLQTCEEVTAEHLAKGDREYARELLELAHAFAWRPPPPPPPVRVAAGDEEAPIDVVDDDDDDGVEPPVQRRRLVRFAEEVVEHVLPPAPETPQPPAAPPTERGVLPVVSTDENELGKKRKRKDVIEFFRVPDETPFPISDARFDAFDLIGYRDDGTTTCSKLNYLVERLRQVTADGSKAIVFADQVYVMDAIVKTLRICEIPSVAFDSRTPPRKRAQNALAFQTSDDARVIVVSLGIAARGLNLHAASFVFFVEIVQDDAVRRQAIGRCHRHGQERTVHVEFLFSPGTVQEGLLTGRMDDAPIVCPEYDGQAGRTGHLLRCVRFTPHAKVDAWLAQRRIDVARAVEAARAALVTETHNVH